VFTGNIGNASIAVYSAVSNKSALQTVKSAL